MARVRFAAAVAATADYPTQREACRIAEAGGFDAYARADHLLAEGALAPAGAPLLECFTTIAALVPTTTRLRFLQTVTCNSFRNPALLAKMVATLDVISGGRMELGLGAGWLRQEYDAYGFDFPSTAIRLEQLREALQVVKLLWTGGPVDFEGRHYRLRGAVLAPTPVQPPRPPILVGGGGPGLRAVAAAEADIVNLVPVAADARPGRSAAGRFTLDRFRRLADSVRQLAATAGRPAPILSAMLFVQHADTEAEADRLLGQVAARYGLERRQAADFPLFLVGTSAQLRERLAARLAALELGHVVLQCGTPAVLERVAAEVLPRP